MNRTFSDRTGHKPAKNPITDASFVSRRTFWFLKHIFKTAHKRPLEETDIYEALDSHKSAPIGELFSNHWTKQCDAKNSHLLKVITSAYGLQIVLVGILFGLTEVVCRVALPLFLGELISYFASPAADERISSQAAYYYATGIVACTLIPVLTFHPFFMYMFQMGIKIRVGCYSLIYERILQHSASSIVDGLNGQVINFLSNDVTNMEIAVTFFHDLWKGPLELFVIGYFIYREIGLASLVGLIFMFSFIPLQAWVGKLAAKYRLKTAKQTDWRVRFMNEILHGIQVIKMYTWENSYAAMVDRIRRKETKAVRGSLYVQATLLSFQIISKVALFLSLVTFVYISDDPVTARKVFVVSSLYYALHLDFIRFWASAIAMSAEAVVSMTRITEFLQTKESADEVDGEQEEIVKLDRDISDGAQSFKSIQLKNVSASWSRPDSRSLFEMRDMHLNIEDKQLCAIVGPVGSGKSTLMNLIMGEMKHSKGSIKINGIMSYASQEPWLFEGSIRQNIIFVEEFDQARYMEVLRVCALERDILGFAHGDQTVVGERGVCLSGGQKARVNLARAIYKRADIYLLDDPLSAVDAHVSTHIMEHCIRRFLSDKIAVVVTHQLKILPEVDRVVVISKGKIDAEGSYGDVQGNDYLKALSDSDDIIDAERTFQLTDEAQAIDQVQTEARPEEEQDGNGTGAVKWSTYTSYLGSVKSRAFVVFTFLLFVFGQVAISCTELFLSKWSTWEESLGKTLDLSDVESIGRERQQYIIVYTLLITISIWLVVQKSFSLFNLTIRASVNLHDRMFRGIIRSLMSFFHNNSSGRILNRFSKDIGSIDLQLPTNVIEVLVTTFELIGVITIVAIVNYWLLIPTAFMLAIFIFLRNIYIKAGRSVKRIEAQTRSPLFSHVNATLQGLSTIRVSGAEKRLDSEFYSHLDHNSSASFLYVCTSRAFAFWLDFVCVFYIAVVTYSFLFLQSDTVTGGNVGLTISQVISLIGVCQWGMRQFAELENQMISVERVTEYADLKSEAALLSSSDSENNPPDNWPSKGALKLESVNLRYSDDGDFVLRNLSVSIQAGEKIGIVGRTGAGKSSIVQALFRLAHVEGTIEIDGINTESLGLHALRSKISIIPQDPVLFAGTLRSNLDPFGHQPDQELWQALESVQLKNMAKKILVAGLDSKISDGGSNFSMGQRQLICLARAILCNNRILVLDEATANVDPETDQLIQSTIRSRFVDCTVLTIAHRLNTVMDSDRVMVMDSGKCVEFGNPSDLLQIKNSIFRSLVDQTQTELSSHS